MRKLIARGFVLEFVSLVALIFAVALAWLGDFLGLSTAAVVSASIGIAVAAFSWALKWEIKQEFRDKLSLYSLLESIEDEALYERGRMVMEGCRVELENLSKGILRIDVGHVDRYLIKFTDAAKHHVRLTHVGLDERRLQMVQPGAENPWYQHNLSLVKRGVVVERFFILRRADAIDSTTGKVKPSIAGILEKQARDGIMVRVVWEESVEDPELIQEFMVVDANFAITGFQSWSGVGYANARVYRRGYDVERYVELLEALQAEGHALSDLGDLLPTSHPDQVSLEGTA
jgi:hypothetical protein